MRRRSRTLRRGVIVVAIVLVAAACQSDGDGDVEGTPIEEPSTVTEATDEPEPDTTPPRSSTETTAPTTPSTDVFATVPAQKTTPPAASPPGEPATETVYEVEVSDTGSYIVVMIDDPLIATVGQDNLDTPVAESEAAEIEAEHDVVLTESGVSTAEKVQDYTNALNGSRRRSRTLRR